MVRVLSWKHWTASSSLSAPKLLAWNLGVYSLWLSACGVHDCHFTYLIIREICFSLNMVKKLNFRVAMTFFIGHLSGKEFVTFWLERHLEIWLNVGINRRECLPSEELTSSVNIIWLCRQYLNLHINVLLLLNSINFNYPACNGLSKITHHIGIILKFFDIYICKICLYLTV
jgi:hypothetical protein